MTTVELIQTRGRMDNLYYKLVCKKHPELNRVTHYVDLHKAMNDIANELNNDYAESCYFTIED